MKENFKLTNCASRSATAKITGQTNFLVVRSAFITCRLRRSTPQVSRKCNVHSRCLGASLTSSGRAGWWRTKGKSLAQRAGVTLKHSRNAAALIRCEVSMPSRVLEHLRKSKALGRLFAVIGAIFDHEKVMESIVGLFRCKPNHDEAKRYYFLLVNGFSPSTIKVQVGLVGGKE